MLSEVTAVGRGASPLAFAGPPVAGPLSEALVFEEDLLNNFSVGIGLAGGRWTAGRRSPR